MSAPRRSGRPPVSRGGKGPRRGGGGGGGKAVGKPPPAGVEARRVAAAALERIAVEGAYANLVLSAMLDRSGLESRDRGFVTELVYGATRMRRSCDWLVDRFVLSDLDPTARAFLRLGAYQLAFLDTPPHAAVSATVSAAPRKLQGLVNAVLRRVASGSRQWPDEATALSYPDWIIDRLTADLGADAAREALGAMNEAAGVTERADGYVQDLGSQWVAQVVGAESGDLVLDVCAAPGGKATALAATGAHVVAADVRPSRVGLITGNVDRLGRRAGVAVVAADGTAPPYRPRSFDRVLLDAPCSGLGSLRRRPDARWRIEPTDVETLARLQGDLVRAALPLVKPGGHLIYSVCTLTAAESAAIDNQLVVDHPDWAASDAPGEPWRPLGRGALLLPQAAGTDGMYVLRLRAPA